MAEPVRIGAALGAHALSDSDRELLGRMLRSLPPDVLESLYNLPEHLQFAIARGYHGTVAKLERERRKRGLATIDHAEAALRRDFVNKLVKDGSFDQAEREAEAIPIESFRRPAAAFVRAARERAQTQFMASNQTNNRRGRM